MNERRKNERRRWGRKVTYPFIDSEGVLVTKNRRRKIDRRDVTEEEEAIEKESAIAPLAAAAKSEQPKSKTSLDISESKVMELEETLQDENEPASNIMSSIKDLEDEILEATDVKSKSSARLEVISAKNSPADKQAAAKKTEEPKKSEAKEETSTKKVSAEAETDSEKDSKAAQDSAELPEIDINEEDTPKPKAKAKAKAKAKKNGKNITIELFIKGKKHVVTTDKDSCVVGRDPSCDIVIQNKFVSRAHAKIILKNGKFLVEDNSFNGTYINFTNGQKIHVSKDEQTLIADGSMSMGKPVDDESKSVIEFKISQ